MEKMSRTIKLICYFLGIVCGFILIQGCFKKGAPEKKEESIQQEQQIGQKFSYVFERKNRRNPFIGVGILPEKKEEVAKKVTQKKEEKTPSQKEEEKLPVTPPATTQPVNIWPGDEETTKVLKEFYSKLDANAGFMYQNIMDSLEDIDELEDDEFTKIFDNIYLIYRFYYQSKKGANLKKYTQTLKNYIKSIEEIFNPVRYIYEYMEELFTDLRNDFVRAQSKPSLFKEVKSNMEYAKKLLYSPLLTIRKKKFKPYIEKIKKETRKKYKELSRKLDTYLALYNDFKNSNISINGYIYNKDKGDENVVFVGNEIKRKGDFLWDDVKILKIGKGEIEVLYKGDTLILHFLEE